MLSQKISFEGVDYPFCEKNSVTEKGYIVWKISENEGGRVLFVFPGNFWKRPWLVLVWRGTFQLSSWLTSHSPQKVGSLHTTLNKIRKLDPDLSTCFSTIPRPKQTCRIAATAIKCHRGVTTMDTKFHYVQSDFNPFSTEFYIFVSRLCDSITLWPEGVEQKFLVFLISISPRKSISEGFKSKSWKQMCFWLRNKKSIFEKSAFLGSLYFSQIWLVNYKLGMFQIINSNLFVCSITLNHIF